MVMKSIYWEDDLYLGVETLDTDHKQIFDILNELFVAAFAGVSDAVLDSTIDRLKTYTHEHFAREEAVMAEVGFPSLEHHCQLHKSLIVELNALTDRIREESKTEVSNDVIVFLREWILVHIRKHDMMLKHYLRKKDGSR